MTPTSSSKPQSADQPIRVGRFMTAHEVMPHPRGAWMVRGKGDAVLGYVEWYAPWRQYVFQPARDTEFSSDCLRAVTSFMGALR